MANVFVNSCGEYLVFGEVSSHSPNVTHGYSWTKRLNDASIARDANYLSKLNWKSGSPIDDIVAELEAEEVRIITLRRKSA